MTEAQAGVKHSIEPLDPSRHNRAAFFCGVPQVDNYFRNTASKLAKTDNVRVFVLVGANKDLIGFYATNAHSIHYADLPARYARNRPGHGTIPAAYISMIGVDTRYQGKGFGGDLLVDCLRRIVTAAAVVGISIVLLDVLDCGDPQAVEKRKNLYLGYGFAELQGQPLRLYMPISIARTLIDEFG